MNKAFTLIEIMVAISVMIIGIVGVYAVIPRIISISAANTSRFIASQIGREGIELVRNIRDANWLEGGVFDDGLTDCASGCEIDYDDSVFVSFQERYLKIDTNGFYNYETGQATKFKRKITITPGVDFLNTKVEITWSGEGSPLEVEENLYNWR